MSRPLFSSSSRFVMARFCAVVLLLMVAPSCEDVDFDRVVREITGYKKGLLEQYLKEYSVLESRVNSLLYDGKKDGTKVDLLEYGNRKLEWHELNTTFPRFKEAYRYHSDKGKRFIDKVLNSFYRKARGVSTEDKLIQSISHEFHEMLDGEEDRILILDRISYSTRDALDGKHSTASLSQIVSEITGYTEQFLEKYTKGYSDPQESQFIIPQYKEAYRHLEGRARIFIDQVLTCFYLGRRGVFSETKLIQTITYEFAEVKGDDRNNIENDRLNIKTSDKLCWSGGPASLSQIATEVTGYTKEFLEDYTDEYYTSKLDNLQLESELKTSFSRYEQAYKGLQYKGRNWIDQVLTSFYLGSRRIFSEDKLKKSLYREYGRLDQPDQEVIDSRVGNYTREALVFIDSPAYLTDMVAEITGYGNKIQKDYENGYSASDIDNSKLLTEDAYKDLSEKAGRCFIDQLIIYFRLNSRGSYFENGLKRRTVLDLRYLDNSDQSIILKRVSDDVKRLLLDKTIT